MYDISILNQVPPQIFLIWDLKSYRILAVCLEGNTCRALMSVEPDCGYGIISTYKPIMHDSKNNCFDLRSMAAEKLAEYMVNAKGIFVLKSSAKDPFYTEALANRGRLLSAKAHSLDQINGLINRSRSRIVPTEVGWSTVHHMRYTQAKEHRKEKNPVTESEHLFLRQFAQAKGLNLDQAADQIIFEYELITMGLFQTEEILLKYMHLVPRVQDKEELGLLMREFAREFYLNARI